MAQTIKNSHVGILIHIRFLKNLKVMFIQFASQMGFVLY